MDMLYRRVLKPILFRFHPDTVHDFFTAVGAFSGRFAFVRWLLGLVYNYKGKDISKTVDGITYRTPILLSAGFDPDGALTRILPILSFGGEEIGSITAHASAGNPRPHFTRLVRNRSIVVYKGLKNAGVDALIKKLSKTPRTMCKPGMHKLVHTWFAQPSFVLGISIARTNEPEASVDVEAGIRDYEESFRKLNEANIGDYYTLNISCPNAYTGEDFTNPDSLAKLLARITAIRCEKPIYIKMPISLPWERFALLTDIADKSGIHGLVIGNLSKEYSELKHPEDAPKKFRGGLSGAPTFARSNELIRKTREKYGTRFTIMGVGGILSADDAMAKFAAGADLIQLISGMVFEGPGLIKEICERYASTR